MHAEVLMFAARTLAGLPRDGHVLEIGARDINGSLRMLLPDAASYVGVDVEPGPGVDVVADGATYEPRQPPSLIICTEVLEHTPNGQDLIEHAAHVLAHGGWLFVTCATEPRAPHSAADGGQVRRGEYYRNVAPDDLRGWVDGAGLSIEQLETHTDRGDLYLLARKGRM
jgi:hypothetical protein